MLTEDEIKRLGQTIAATIASPLIGSIEDYTREAIFHHVKNIPLSDPSLGRSKLLYDAVNTTTSTGWSLKSLQLKKLTNVNTFSFVIQRADIVKKATQLGFLDLTEKSSPDELGKAIIKHWNDKITYSQTAQGVSNSYESILLKTIEGYDLFTVSSHLICSIQVLLHGHGRLTKVLENWEQGYKAVLEIK